MKLALSKSLYNHIQVADQSIIHVNKFYLAFKRGFDILGALCGILVFSPMFLFISILYLFGRQKGPVFFKQQRTGLNGKSFYIYKFRSMVMNAEEKLKKDKNLYQKYKANSYKLDPKEDPRITKIGKFLRKTSLDELPQLINVLRGDMSLVGPRPVVKEELAEYGDRIQLFLSCKPGITGYWQAYGRSEISYPERVDVELHYIYHQSFALDLKILIYTISSVIKSKGAY
jgi:lipopolysaccharide/colanic/teichoic acid biosynthesis glycosyltransferase